MKATQLQPIADQLRTQPRKDPVAARRARVQMSLADDLPDCEECLKLMVEDLAKSVADPKNLALLPPEEAEKATEHLRELLGQPER